MGPFITAKSPPLVATGTQAAIEPPCNTTCILNSLNGRQLTVAHGVASFDLDNNGGHIRENDALKRT